MPINFHKIIFMIIGVRGKAPEVRKTTDGGVNPRDKGIEQ